MKRLPILLIAIFFFCLPFLLGVSPFVRTDGEPQVQGPLSVYNGFNVKTGTSTLTGDLVVDGGEIGVTGDLDLLQLSNGDLDVNGTSEFVGNMTLPATGAGDADSYKVVLEANQAAGPVTHTASIYALYDGANSYLGISAPNATGVETPVFVILHDVVYFATDDTVDIGGSGVFRPKDIWLSGNLHAEAGQITANTNVVATTGYVQAGGDIVVDGGEIGLTGDLDLLQIAANALTINGTTALNGTSTWNAAAKLSTGAEAAPDVDAGGICLDQNALDNNIMTFKSSDLAHGVTDELETDSYAGFKKVAATTGGLRITGVSEASEGVLLLGVVKSPLTTRGAVTLHGAKGVSNYITSLANDIPVVRILMGAGGEIAKILGNGDFQTDGDHIVDGGLIGITGDLDLISMAAGALTINGTTAAEGAVTLGNAGGDANSYKIVLQSHMTAGDETQTSSMYTAWGLDPYLVIATPNATGVETNTVHIDHNSIVMAVDNFVDIGATGANRPKDIFLSGNLDAEVGAITAQTNITADTGNIVATAGSISANTTVTGGTGVTATTGDVTATAGDVVAGDDVFDVLGDVRLIYPVVSAADPAEPFDCTAAVLGRNIIVDDTDDGTNQVVCVCLGIDDVITYEWQRADDNSTICPSLP